MHWWEAIWRRVEELFEPRPVEEEPARQRVPVPAPAPRDAARRPVRRRRRR